MIAVDYSSTGWVKIPWKSGSIFNGKQHSPTILWRVFKSAKSRPIFVASGLWYSISLASGNGQTYAIPSMTRIRYQSCASSRLLHLEKSKKTGLIGIELAVRYYESVRKNSSAPTTLDRGSDALLDELRRQPAVLSHFRRLLMNHVCQQLQPTVSSFPLRLT